MKLALTFLTVLLLSPLAVVHAADSPQKPGKPNIVFIYADDWGWGDLSRHGSTWLRTPHLDGLAAAGIDFGQFNVLNPVCSPSRTAVMTGQYPARWGVHQHFAHPAQNRQRDMPDWLDPRATTLPGLLRAAGYRTGMFGKWHLGDNYPYRPQDRGFQESIWYQSSSIPSAAGYFNNDYFDDVYQHNGVDRKFEGYTTDVFFREAKAWIRQQAERRQPFLCYLPLAAAHRGLD